MMAPALPGSRFVRDRWRDFRESWLARRVPPEASGIHLHRRRLFILPTRLGYTYALVVLALLLGSMNYDSNIGFAVTFLLVGIGLLGMLHTHRNLRGLALHFGPAAPVFAGQAAEFPLSLDAGDRDRWGIHLTAGTGAATGPLAIPAEQTLSTSLAVTTRDRGRMPLPRTTLVSCWPLGLFRVWSWLRPAVHALVYPRPVDHGMPTPWSLAPESAGDPAVQADEDSFAGLRAYQPGDPPRRIAWKVLARTDRLYSQAFDQRGASVIWLDWQGLPQLDFEHRLEQICHWLLRAHQAGYRFGLVLPDRQLEPDSGSQHLQRCLEALALTGEAGA